VLGDVGETFFLMAQVASSTPRPPEGEARGAGLDARPGGTRSPSGTAIDCPARSRAARRARRTAGRPGRRREAPGEADATPLEAARDLYLAGSQLAPPGEAPRRPSGTCGAPPSSTPTNFSAWFLRGAAHLALDQDEPAVLCFAACVSLRPDFAPAWLNRGLAYSRLRQFGTARDDYDQALKLDPKYAEAYIQRGEAREAAATATARSRTTPGRSKPASPRPGRTSSGPPRSS
jgi:tetratricopeptide (TPR) repeat protein